LAARVGRHENLGGRVRGRAVGAERQRGRVAGEHTAAVADHQVRGTAEDREVDDQVGGGEHAVEQPLEARTVQLVVGHQPGQERLRAQKRAGQHQVNLHRDRRNSGFTS
jgi:hypothetical protein